MDKYLLLCLQLLRTPASSDPAALTLRLSARLFHFCSSDLPSGVQKKNRLINLGGRNTLNKLNYCKCRDRCYLGWGSSRPELPTFSLGDHHHVLVPHQHVLDMPHCLFPVGLKQPPPKETSQRSGLLDWLPSDLEEQLWEHGTSEYSTKREFKAAETGNAHVR